MKNITKSDTVLEYVKPALCNSCGSKFDLEVNDSNCDIFIFQYHGNTDHHFGYICPVCGLQNELGVVEDRKQWFVLPCWVRTKLSKAIIDKWWMA